MSSSAGDRDRLSGYEVRELQDIANKIRVNSIIATNKAKSGHPTSCSSVAEILAILFFKVMRYKISEPRHPTNDRLVLSKGHAAPALYAAWSEAGLFTREKLWALRSLYSDFEGHPTPRLNFVDVATGSLGHGLSVAAGMALVGKKVDLVPFRVYCIIGDSESSEGSIWEACTFAGYYKLDNLCLIIDCNRLGQTGQTPLAHDTDLYFRRFASFGFNTLTVDGHNIEELVHAFETAAVYKGKPTAIIAKTLKGKNFLQLENVNNHHAKPLYEKADKIVEYIENLISNKGPTTLRASEPDWDYPDKEVDGVRQLSVQPNYNQGDLVATREALGTALVKLAQSCPRLLVFDADVRNSTYTERLREYDDNKYVQCFMCEQNMVGVALGVTRRTSIVAFVATFASFLTRAFDQIRMSAICKANVTYCGSHCGVSVGEDGTGQMGLEDIAMFRSIPGCTIFYPSDAVSAEKAVELAANIQGMCYIRLTRPRTAVIYANDKMFRVGQAHIHRKTETDQVLIITGGITLIEALDASKMLSEKGVFVRVMDLFTIEPIDVEAIKVNGKECNGKIITVEDHYPNGGIGESVLSALAEETDMIVRKIAIPKIPRSGQPFELLDYFGVSACNIVVHVLEFLHIELEKNYTEMFYTN